jgi:exopolysaccharide production protein ExoZ
MSGKIQSIQALRAFASPLVALSHLLNIAVASGGAALITIKTGMHAPADAAVACFFTVSGFIMTMLADKGRSPADFALRRIIRIFPAYWIVLPVMLLLPPLPGAAHETSLAQLLLLQAAQAHPITWALMFEIYFYIAVTLIMLCCRGSIARGFALFAVVHVAAILLIPSTDTIIQPAAASFWIGTCVYLATTRLKTEWPSLLVIAAAIALLLTQTTFGPQYRGNNMILYASFFGPIFVMMIVLERGGVFSVPAPIIWWSNRSYSLFLWHIAVMTLAALAVQTWSSFSTPSGLALFAALSLTGSVAVALIGYRFVELPVTSWLNGLVERPAKAENRPSPGVATGLPQENIG